MAAACFQVDKRKRQIVVAEEPGKYVQSLGLPFWVTVRLPGRQASRNCRSGFQWLLIEHAWSGTFIAKALCADGAENSRRACLLAHKPAQRPQASLRIGLCARRN